MVARYADESIVAPTVGSDGVWRQAVGFCWVRIWRDMASVAVKMFSHLICFVNKFDKCCTFSAIFKGNAAVNCVTAQHK
jgi:hypothetical protein